MQDNVYVSVNDIVDRNPALTIGGVRDDIFHNKAELVRAGALIQDGRKIIINEPKYFEYKQQKSIEKLEAVS